MYVFAKDGLCLKISVQVNIMLTLKVVAETGMKLWHLSYLKLVRISVVYDHT